MCSSLKRWSAKISFACSTVTASRTNGSFFLMISVIFFSMAPKSSDEMFSGSKKS